QAEQVVLPHEAQDPLTIDSEPFSPKSRREAAIPVGGTFTGQLLKTIPHFYSGGVFKSGGNSVERGTGEAADLAQPRHAQRRGLLKLLLHQSFHRVSPLRAG